MYLTRSKPTLKALRVVFIASFCNCTSRPESLEILVSWHVFQLEAEWYWMDGWAAVEAWLYETLWEPSHHQNTHTSTTYHYYTNPTTALHCGVSIPDEVRKKWNTLDITQTYPNIMKQRSHPASHLQKVVSKFPIQSSRTLLQELMYIIVLVQGSATQMT